MVICMPAKYSIMMDLESTHISKHEKRILQSNLIGGVILFTRNFESSQQLIELTAQIRQVANRDIIIAADQEGGRVQRFKTDQFTRIPAMGELCKKQVSLSRIKDIAWLLAYECLMHGIDLSFAPVLDIDNGSDVVGDRAFSSDIATTIEYSQSWCEGMKSAGMATVGKHFPGHGSTKADTHNYVAEDPRTLENIMNRDGKVFSHLFNKSLLDGIMPAHIRFSEVETSPVGYSKTWLQTILRQQLGFGGVIFSDDLSMVGAGQDLSYPEKAQLALNAGCDMALVCNNPAGVEDIVTNLESQLTNIVSSAIKLRTKIAVDNDAEHVKKREQVKQFLTLLES